MTNSLLEVKNLKKHFPIKSGLLSRKTEYVKAVDGLNFEIEKGEIFGLVGESGCGKSTTGRLIINLLKPTEGDILYNGENIVDLNKKELKKIRREIQIIFQDPYSSLDPRLTVAELVSEGLEIHKMVSNKKEKREKVVELLEAVGLGEHHLDRYPHEFSGGQRQRIGIARALALNPRLLICDEPVSALDVSVQAQIINLMRKLKEEHNLTYLFISHDLSVVHHLCDRIAVMYLGKIVEIATKSDLFNNSKHPYTKALLDSIPQPNKKMTETDAVLQGDITSPVNPSKRCAFHTRCKFAMEKCKLVEPKLQMVGDGHVAACHLNN